MDDPEALRQQLRDEAAWRSFVEDELAREAEKARIWQERAEARARRIDRLVAGRSLRQALATRLAGTAVPSLRIPGEDDALGTAVDGLRPARPARSPAHPEVRAVALVDDPAVGALADELDRRDVLELGEDAFRDADLGVIDASGWREHVETRELARTWLERDDRPPVVWFGAVPETVTPLLRARDGVVGGDGDRGPARDVQLAPWAGQVPRDKLPRDAMPGRWVDTGVGRALVTTKGVALVVVDGSDPQRELGLAYGGIPVVGGHDRAPHGLPSPDAPLDLDALGRGDPVPPGIRRLAIRQRRYVHSAATPALRVGLLLEELGVPAATKRPRLAALLSSNRPALVPDQLAALGDQRRRPDEVRLALHGGASAAERRAIDAAAEARDLVVHCTTPAADVPLGTVLNQLADATTAELLAKIDDDDHYGPAHLLDAVAALERTGADLVGNKAHYVHLTGEDHTWLLAEDAEDVWTGQGLMGATFVWRRALMDHVRFSPRPRRVDSLYVRAAAAAGARLYARPANDFAYIRDPGGRTNVAGPAYVRARGRDVGPGLPLDAIDV